MTNGSSSTTLKEVIERVINNSKPIPEFPNYFISKAGFVYKFKSGKLRKIKFTQNDRGYFQVSIKHLSGYKTRYVHILYKTVFGEPVPEELLCEVIEGIKPNKLNSEDVKVIRERNSSGESYRRIALEYNVSHTQIKRICKKEQWQDV